MPTTIEKLSLRLIIPDPNNPRQSFDQEKLQELAASIQSIGQEQPISVRPRGDRFVIIQGHRRFHAHQLIDAETIDAIVRDDISEKDAALRQIVENLQRADLSPIEEAKGFQSAMERLHLKQKQLAEKLGIKRLRVQKALALLNTDQAVQQALASGAISAGHGEALVTLSHGKQVAVLSAIKADGLTVAETRRHIRAGDMPAESSTSNITAETHQVSLLQKAADAVKSVSSKLINKRFFANPIYYQIPGIKRLLNDLYSGYSEYLVIIDVSLSPILCTYSKNIISGTTYAQGDPAMTLKLKYRIKSPA